MTGEPSQLEAEVLEVTTWEAIADQRLRARAAAAATQRTRYFIAVRGGREAGYLAFEHHLTRSMAVIYELLVIPECRRARVGSGLVLFAHTVARSLGCSSVRLSATAFDRSVEQSWLEGWYASLGYQPVPGAQELEFRLS